MHSDSITTGLTDKKDEVHGQGELCGGMCTSVWESISESCKVGGIQSWKQSNINLKKKKKKDKKGKFNLGKPGTKPGPSWIRCLIFISNNGISRFLRWMCETSQLWGSPSFYTTSTQDHWIRDPCLMLLADFNDVHKLVLSFSESYDATLKASWVSTSQKLTTCSVPLRISVKSVPY